MNRNTSTEKRRKLPFSGKTRIIALCVIALFFVCAVVTLAYIITQTGSLVNTFTPTTVQGDIVETLDGAVKKEVKVTNNGTADAYVRATIVVYWQAADGSIYPATPVAGTHYAVTYSVYADGNNTTADTWVYSDTDGYWYFINPVKFEDSTAVLIDACSEIADKTPSGYNLVVEIISETIQATPATAVTEAWSSGVSGVSGTALQIKTSATDAD